MLQQRRLSAPSPHLSRLDTLKPIRKQSLAGLRSRRVRLDRSVPVLQVVEVRYQAGSQFGSGFKGRPKSDAGIRELPLTPLVVESIRRQSHRRRPGGPCLHRPGRRQWRPRRLADDAVAVQLPPRLPARGRRAGHDLAAVDLHGPDDLRHTFSTWLEDAGVPARVIDELMGHERAAAATLRAEVASVRAIATPPRRWPSAWPTRSNNGSRSWSRWRKGSSSWTAPAAACSRPRPEV